MIQTDSIWKALKDVALGILGEITKDRTEYQAIKDLILSRLQAYIKSTVILAVLGVSGGALGFVLGIAFNILYGKTVDPLFRWIFRKTKKFINSIRYSSKVKEAEKKTDEAIEKAKKDGDESGIVDAGDSLP